MVVKSRANKGAGLEGEVGLTFGGSRRSVDWHSTMSISASGIGMLLEQRMGSW